MSNQGGPQLGLRFLSGQLGLELLVVWPPSRQSPSLEGNWWEGTGSSQCPRRQEGACAAPPRERAAQAYTGVLAARS